MFADKFGFIVDWSLLGLNLVTLAWNLSTWSVWGIPVSLIGVLFMVWSLQMRYARTR